VRQIAAGPVISVDYDELRNNLTSFGEKDVRVELWPGEGVPDKEHCHFAQIKVDFELACGDAGTTDGGVDGGTTDASADGAVTDGSADGSIDAPGPESGLDAARSDADDSSLDARDGEPTTTPDGNIPDSSVRDGSEASLPNDGSTDSG
jgi:hypothetical protein